MPVHAAFPAHLERVCLLAHRALRAQHELLVLVVQVEELAVLGDVEGGDVAHRPLLCRLLCVLRHHLGAHLATRLADAFRERCSHHSEERSAFLGFVRQVIHQLGVLDDERLHRRLRGDRHAGQLAKQERHLADEVTLAALGNLFAAFEHGRGALANVDGGVERLTLDDEMVPRGEGLRRSDLCKQPLAEVLLVATLQTGAACPFAGLVLGTIVGRGLRTGATHDDK